MYRTLIAIQNVCLDVGAIIKEAELSVSSYKNKKESKDSKESLRRPLGTKPVRPSLTQV